MDSSVLSFSDQLYDVEERIRKELECAASLLNSVIQDTFPRDGTRPAATLASLDPDRMRLLMQSSRFLLNARRLNTAIGNIAAQIDLHEQRFDTNSPAAQDTDFFCNSPPLSARGSGGSSDMSDTSPCPFLRNPSRDPFCGASFSEMGDFILK